MILKNNRQFQVFPTEAGLRDHVLYYNLVFPARDTFPAQYTLMPNACGTLSLAFDGESVLAQVWGASLAPVLLGGEPNRYRVLLLIQLSPYGLYQITRQSQIEFAGKRLSLGDVDGGLFQSLERAFSCAESTGELLEACNQILRRRMETRVVSGGVLLADQVITGSRGTVRVKEAARCSGYSERQLNRLFLTQVGMSVKSYARLVRFNYVLKHIQKRPGFFADLSQRAGYFDQAHFDKDFKAISGVSPRKYLESMSGFYYDGTEVYRTIPSKEE